MMLVLASCANVNDIKNLDQATVSSFNKALAIGYKDFAKKSSWRDSSYFKLKSKNAAKGQEVLPEDVSKWKNIPEVEVDNLRWARIKLDNVLIDSVRADYPVQLANIQKLYDCWLEMESRGVRKEKIEECRMEFILEIGVLESILMPILPVEEKQAYAQI